MVEREQPPRARRGPYVVAGVLLALPVIAVLWVGSYAREGPELAGFPFFYWYQFLWVSLAAGCTSVAYRVVTAEQRRRRVGRQRP